VNEHKYEEGATLFSQALDIDRRVLGEDHPNTLLEMNNLAVVYQMAGKYQLAEALFGKILGVRQRVLGPDSLDTLRTSYLLGNARLKQHRYREAEETLRDTLRRYEGTNPQGWQRYNCEALLGASLGGQKRFREAEQLLLSGYAGMVERKAAIPEQSHFYIDDGRQAIIRLYEDWGKPDQVARWRAAY
jgi:tetratricopeptide (TPR) repeat protein